MIRDYEDTDINALPDERYQIRLDFYYDDQIREMRSAYDIQFEELKKELVKVVDVVQVLYNDYKAARGIEDYNDVAARYLKEDKGGGGGWFSARVEE